MNENMFKLHYEKSNLTNSNYVTISAGKGKNTKSTIYIDTYDFSYIEGLFWDKYREFGNRNKLKISSSDLQRVVDGIIIAKDKLEISKIDGIKEVLKFNIINPKNPVNEVAERVPELKAFFLEFVNWILGFIQTEKYFIITRV